MVTEFSDTPKAGPIESATQKRLAPIYRLLNLADQVARETVRCSRDGLTDPDISAQCTAVAELCDAPAVRAWWFAHVSVLVAEYVAPSPKARRATQRHRDRGLVLGSRFGLVTA